MGAIPRVPDCFAGTGGVQVLSQVRMPCSEGEPNKCTPQANAKPHNLKHGVSKPYDLHFSGNECEVIIGSNRFRQRDDGDDPFLIAVAVDGDVLVGFRLVDKHYFLNVLAFDEYNLRVLEIVDNVLSYSISPWDIQWVGRRLSFREEARGFLLEIQFNPPNQAHIQRGRLLRNGVEFRISPKEIVVNDGVGISGMDFFGRWGVVVGEPEGGNLYMRRVNRYRRDASKAQ